MGKFIDKALIHLQEGNTDELQKELYKIERSWIFLNKIRSVLEENNQDLVARNNELVLNSQRLMEEKRRIVIDGDLVRGGLQQQMANVQVSKAAELEELVNTNVRLQRETRKLKRELAILKQQQGIKE